MDTATERATRVALVRIAFPYLADAADADADRREILGTTGRGLAEGVIHVAVTTPTLWNRGRGFEAEGSDGSWESYLTSSPALRPRIPTMRPWEVAHVEVRASLTGAY